MFARIVVIGLSFFPQTNEETKLQRLHTQAINATSEKDYVLAKKTYEEMLTLISVNKIDWATYIDVHLKLAEAHFHLKEYFNGKILLTALLKKSPPLQFLPSIEIFIARLDFSLGMSAQAYLTLKKIASKTPLEKWKGEDRSFYHAVEIHLSDYFTDLRKKAKRLTLSKNYKEAITSYEKILKAIEEDSYPNVTTHDILYKKIRFQLAESLFLEGKFQESLAHLDDSNKDSIYLAAKCYKEKKEYTKALELFTQYLESKDENELKHYFEACFEIAFVHYNSENWVKAKEGFEKVLEAQKEQRVQNVATLYLAKTHLKQQEFKESKSLLEKLKSKLKKTDPLLPEIDYLQGCIAFHEGKLSQACHFFENSLSTNEFYEWSKPALFKLAESYRHLAANSPNDQLEFFEKGLKIYQNLSKISKDESITLAKASLFIVKGDQEGKKILLDAVETFSQEGQIHALLMLSEIEENLAEKKKILTMATDAKFEKTTLYPQSFYLLGLFELNQGFFELAHKAFSKAYTLYEKKDLKKARQSLQAQAKADFFRNAPLLALQTLEKIESQYDLNGSEKEELLYLRALFVSKVESLQSTAFSYLNELSKCYPEGKYASTAAFLKATLYFNQKDYDRALNCFLDIEARYENCPFSAQSLFWAAETLEKQNASKDKILEIRQKCFQKYPKDPIAPYAYLKCYSFEEYREASQEALLHLKAFSELFPNSCLISVVSFFLGQNESDHRLALELYEKGYTINQEHLKKPSLLYFRYKSMIEAATLMIAMEEFEEAAKLLEEVISEFKEKSGYPCLLEESEFTLSQLLLKQKEEKKAKSLLLKMLESYERSGQEQGYFLSHVWQELGKMAMNKKEFQTAYECLEEAYECGQKHLYPDQRLNLWILQSHCLQAQNKNEMALRLLSKVVNEDVVSPLRLKAMYLRAEIYEKEEKHEWAIRQLESLAKKGGLWGEKAEEKLRIRYGIR